MPASLLLDSDILIDHLRKDEKALHYLQQEVDAGSLLFISVISRTEIFSGVRKGEEEGVLALLDLLTPVDKEMGGSLVTRNLKHYPMKDIRIIKPY